MTKDQIPGRGPAERHDYAALVASLARTLDLRGGLTEAVNIASYATISDHIGNLMNLDSGLQAALAASHQPPATGGGRDVSSGSRCTPEWKAPFPRATNTAIKHASVDPTWLTVTLSTLADKYHVPGAQLAVRRDGVTVAVEVGELEHKTGIPITRSTAFPIGSISTAWTATLAMILVADGDLELDAPLVEALPELEHDIGRKITLCQLLSHTSGFASSPDTPEMTALSLGSYVHRHCRRQDLVLPPGSGFSYSNRNYALVGYLIEHITGMSWMEAIETILLRPLGIESTFVCAPRQWSLSRALATGHSVNMAVGRIRSVKQSVVPAEAPATALAMSAVDLVALGLLHVESGFHELLPAAWTERMRLAVPEAHPSGSANGWSPGLAVFQDGATDWVGHDGNASGTSCHLRIDAAGGQVIALTTNADTGPHLWEELRVKLRGLNLPKRAHLDSTPTPTFPALSPPGLSSNGPVVGAEIDHERQLDWGVG